MRTSVVVLLCTAVVLALLDSTSAQSLSPYIFQIGQRTYAYTDKQFTRERIEKPSTAPHVKTYEIKEFLTDGKARITMIEATNLKKNGATVKILGGGPGQTHVTLQFESPAGQGLSYDVKVFTKY